MRFSEGAYTRSRVHGTHRQKGRLHHKSNRVKSCKNTDRTSKEDGGYRSSPSADKLKQILGPSPTPRMLTPYEIELLRKSKREMAEIAREVLAGQNHTSESKDAR